MKRTRSFYMGKVIASGLSEERVFLQKKIDLSIAQEGN